MTGEVRYYATGKRKTAIARVWIWSGKGKVEVNGKDYSEYFNRPLLQSILMSPLEVTETTKKISVKATVKGGGISGQAGAMRHALARALVQYNEDFKSVLKSEDMFTRDPRMKERKKYGQPGARKRFQFSKR